MEIKEVEVNYPQPIKLEIELNAEEKLSLFGALKHYERPLNDATGSEVFRKFIRELREVLKD